MMHRIFWMIVTVILCLRGEGVLGQSDPLTQCRSMYEGVGVPKYHGSRNFTILCRDGYLLSHNNERKVPDWVLESLVPERFQGSGDRDRSQFAPDPNLPQGQRAELTDYAGSGYDRGHMAPAADMKYSQAVMDQSFYLSNMAPQVGIGFNRHIWARLEDQVRIWTERRGKLVVITGPIFGADRIGQNGVALPTHFYKIVYEPARRRAIALMLPNEKIRGNDLRPFVISIDDIEEFTGLDFLPDLPDSVEPRIERNVGTLWRQ